MTPEAALLEDARRADPERTLCALLGPREHRAAILNASGRDTGMGHSYRLPDDGGMRHYWTLLIGSE